MKSKNFFFLFLFSLLICSVALIFVPSVVATSYTVVLSSTDGGYAFFGIPNVATRFSEGTYSMVEGQAMVFNVQPDSGYVFAYWMFNSSVTNGVTAVNPIPTNVESSFNLTAVFVPSSNLVNYEVILDVDGGNGSIHATAASYSFGSGTNSVPSGVLMVVTASSDVGYTFGNFTVVGSGMDGLYLANPISFVVSSDTNVTVAFAADAASLVYDLNIAGSGGGNVTWSYEALGGVLKGTQSGFGYFDMAGDANMTLYGVANDGYIFDYWLFDGDSVTSNPFSFDMDAEAHTVTAVFRWVGNGNDDGSFGGVGIDWSNIADSFDDLPDVVKLMVCFVAVFAPPLVVLVLVPKVGMAGFSGMFAFTLSIGVMFLGLPVWLLGFVALGLGIMFYSLMMRG